MGELAAMSANVQATREPAEREEKSAEAARSAAVRQAAEVAHNASARLQEERARFARKENISEAKVDLAHAQAAVAEAMLQQDQKKLSIASARLQASKHASEQERVAEIAAVLKAGEAV